MSRNRNWCKVILTVATLALLLVPEVCEAQRGGRGGGGRGGSGYGRGYGDYGRGYGYGYGRGYWFGGVWYPGYWDGGVWNGSPGYDVGPVYDQGYYPPQPPYPGADQAATPTGSLVVVRVPDPAAEVWFNNQLMQTSGLVRTFHTGALEPNYSYFYTVRARWMVNGRPVEESRQIQVYPGRGATVDFSVPMQMPAPAGE